MRILIDARLYGLENTGIGRYVMNLVGELLKNDKQNEYVILLRKKYFNQLNFPDNWKKVLVNFKHYSFSEQIKLPGIIKKEKPDLIHFPHFNVPVLLNLPYVVTIHDLLMHYQKGLEATTLNPLAYYFKRPVYKLVFNLAVKNAQKIIVPSEFVKNEILKYYNLPQNKINVIYEGVNKIEVSNEEKILKKYALSDNYLFYVGNAYPHKNLRRAIEAIVLLNQESNQEISFVISCARNIFSARLEKTIKDLKAENYVKILNFVTDQELTVLYKNSLALLFPSLSEGFSLPGVEAMATGTICLASDIPVHKEIFKDAAFYFDPYNLQSIKKGIEEVRSLSKEKREEKIKKGKVLASTYSWDKMAKETLKIYESCFSLRSR